MRLSRLNAAWASTRVPAVAVASLALSALLPTTACAQAGRAQVEEGNRLYEEGRYQEAHQKYLEGLAAAPESPLILFNDGNALYRSEDYQRAMEAYREAVESGEPEVASGAWYNLGNALYRQQQLEPSLEAYKQALRLSPNDVDAKHNLERVLRELQQQQQQDQQQQDEQQDPQQQGQQDPQSDQQDQQEPQRPDEGDQQEQQQDQGQGEPERRPGQMTPEEAERILDAIDEDPEDVDRRRAAATGPRPRRPW
ncbi:MAG TPA: tetratricopeptide repeat protein [Longimicrobiales bacterium]|nr:tetratricopeptide repeat protein [Longimicrobiales bacterium]